jgi:hypothetical protein
MQIIDGAAFTAHGLSGGLFADALLTASACIVLAVILRAFRAAIAKAEAASTQLDLEPRSLR